MSPNAPKVVLTAKIDAELLARLDALAEQMKCSRSQAVEWMLLYGLDDAERVVRMLTEQTIVNHVRAALLDSELLHRVYAATSGDKFNSEQFAELRERLRTVKRSAAKSGRVSKKKGKRGGHDDTR